MIDLNGSRRKFNIPALEHRKSLLFSKRSYPAAVLRKNYWLFLKRSNVFRGY